MIRLLAIAVFCGGAFVSAAGHAQDTGQGNGKGDAQAGRDIAIAHCTRCHVVGDANPHGGINSTPSFQLLARRDDWRPRFQTFFDRRPHPVFVRVPGVPAWTDLPSVVTPFEITFDQIEDVVAFVETLVPK